MFGGLGLRVSIIGGAGKMGAWFAKYFVEHGHEVIISDVRMKEAKALAGALGAKLAENNLEAARMADLSLISTPIDVTPKVLTEILPELKESKIIVEISSLKSKVLPVMKNIARYGVKALSIHPLFGSGAKEMVGERIALIPLRDQTFEEKLAKKIFPDAEIIVVSEGLHDNVMALTLALTHFVNIIFASVVSEEDIELLKRLGGTTFMLQLALSEGVMTEKPSLYASIQIDNKYAAKYLKKFMFKAAKLKEIIEKKDFESFIKFYMTTRKLLSKDEEFAEAYEKMYRALKALRVANY